MTDDETYEYRVTADVPIFDGGLYPIETDWDYRRDWMTELARSLRDAGLSNVEIHSRRVGFHVDIKEVPE